MKFDLESLQHGVFKDLAHVYAGLVFVAGRAGSGRSTTVAAYLESINATQRCHIVTLGDPGELRLEPRESWISQREVGRDLATRREAIAEAPRLGADVLYAGELDDGGVIEAAIGAALEGVLVVGTLTADTLVDGLSRLLAKIPAWRRWGLAHRFRFAFGQRMVPLAATPRPVFEALGWRSPVQNGLLDGRTTQLYSMQECGGHYGMWTFEQALAKLCFEEDVDEETARAHTDDPKVFDRELGFLRRKGDA